LNHLYSSFAVFGLSKFGYQAAVSLSEAGADVIVIDVSEELIQKISGQVTRTICADVLNADVLEKTGALGVDVAIIGLREAFDDTVLLITHLKKSPQIKKIISLVDSDDKGDVLRQLGVDQIIFPEHDSAQRLVRQLTIPHLLDEITLTHEASLIELDIPDDYAEKSLAELNIRAQYHIYVIGVIRKIENGKPILIAAPDPEMKLVKGDRMICMGSSEKLAIFAAAQEN